MGNVKQLPAASGAAYSRPTPITSAHDVSAFDCGKASLTDWLRERALKNEGRSARTYVVCQNNQVMGYYCLAAGGISLSEVPNNLRRNMPNPVPIMVIGRLAVHSSIQRSGIKMGLGLLKDAIQRSIQAATIMGMTAIVVHALDDDAKAFYLKYGFVEFPQDSRTLFLPISMAGRAIP